MRILVRHTRITSCHRLVLQLLRQCIHCPTDQHSGHKGPLGGSEEGHLGAVGVGTGTYAVGGSLEVYLNDGSLYQTAIADSPISVEWRSVDTAGNGYAIKLPRAKLGVPTVNAGSMDTDVMLGFDFTATPATSGGLNGKLIALDRMGVIRQ